MNRIFQTPALSIWLSAFFLLSAGTPQGSTLCLGLDGHLTIEAAGETGRCDTDSWPGFFSHTEITPGESDREHCGPCLDLTVSILTSRTSEVSSQPSPVVGYVIYEIDPDVAGPFSVYEHKRNSYQNPPSQHSLLAALRSTILLI
jgi:hypothetical protein